MYRKHALHILMPAIVLAAVFGGPAGVQAGGVCGGTYIAEAGDTVEEIAVKCGTTASAIYAANPGIGSSLYAGQSLTVPGSTYSGGGSIPPPATPVPYYHYSGTYIVQYGDTFSAIAARFGVSVSSLWAANPHIANINIIYVGQVLYVPGSSGTTSGSTTVQAPTHLSYGSVPVDASKGTVTLTNRSGGDVYVSLQGTTRDGIKVINEYSVSGTMKVNVPLGWYVYVAWVGGKKYSGNFNLSGRADHAIQFYNSKVVVE